MNIGEKYSFGKFEYEFCEQRLRRLLFIKRGKGKEKFVSMRDVKFEEHQLNGKIKLIQ